MFYLVLCLCVITVRSIGPDCGLVTFHGSQTLIIGGKSAQRGEVPWHAAIYSKTTRPYQQICGGSLVTLKVVLSAAHCFWDDVQRQLPVENYAVGVGKLNRSWNTNLTKEAHQRSDAKEITLPVRYQGNEANNQEDIAIIIVTTPFQYTTFVRPVCVDFSYDFERKQLQPGNYGKVAGWGLTGENGPSSQVLKVIELPYVDTKTCIFGSPYTFRPHITGDKFCAGFKDSNQAVCKGDSGGGLAFPNTDKGLTRYYLRGIVSSAPAGDNRCNANAYTSFTQLLKHEHFIKLLYGMTSTGDSSGYKCNPIPLILTSKKTGQKAWDKCIEYQEKYVFPCENKAATGELGRSNRCHHNADVLHNNESEAALNEYPHMAHVGFGNDVSTLEWLCGGSLISEKFVMTAAHCLVTRDSGNATYVALGILKRSDLMDRNRYKVKQFLKYPEYRPPSKYHDIGLLELEKTVVLNEFLVPACIHTGDVVDDALAAATGWGLMSYRGQPSNVLKKMILKKHTSEDCAKEFQPSRFTAIGLDPNTQLCYENIPTSSDTCQGDTGGPLQIKSKKIACMYTVIGVTSYGKGCGFTGIPAIYTRVAFYLDWIEKTVWG